MIKITYYFNFKLISFNSINFFLKNYSTNSLDFEEKKALIKSYTKIQEHDSRAISFIVGNVLGDGHIARRGVSARLSFCYSEKQLEYVKYLQAFYQSLGYCSNNILKITPSLIKERGGSVQLKTFSFSSFILLHDLFYRKATVEEKDQKKNWIKIIPPNIEKYLTAEALAIWYMDDGTFDKANQYIIFCTNCFTIKEHLLLQNTLKINFNLNFNIKKQSIGKFGEQQHNLWLPRNQVRNFIKIVKPFMVKTMYYKLGLDLDGKPKFKVLFILKTIFNNPELLDNAFLAEYVSYCGSFYKRDRCTILSTQKANLEEVVFLQSLLKEKFNLHFTIQKGNTITRILYLSRVQVPILIEIVKPFMSKDNLYKLGL